MKTTLVKHTGFIVFLFVILMFFYSCKKAGDDQANNNSFTWVQNGINHTTNLDTAYVALGGLSLSPYTIMAGENKPGYIFYRRVEFNLTSFNVGTHTVNAGSGAFNRLTYTDDAGTTMIGAGGTLNITANSNNYMSGNFSATLITGAGVSNLLTGNFTNMPIR
jgi:hypothetical protein